MRPGRFGLALSVDNLLVIIRDFFEIAALRSPRKLAVGLTGLAMTRFLGWLRMTDEIATACFAGLAMTKIT